MNWRERRRGELLRLGVTDPALLTIHYFEVAQQAESSAASKGQMPLAAMIDAILDGEEALFHSATSVRRPPARAERPPLWTLHIH